MDDDDAHHQNDETDPAERKRTHQLRSLLVKLSKESGILPKALFVEGVMCENREYVAGGGFADIYKATLQNQPVALKRLRNLRKDKYRGHRHLDGETGQEGICTKSTQAFSREAVVWRQLGHPHILPFLGVDDHTFGPRLCMVSPWMTFGSIMQCISELVADGNPIPFERWVCCIVHLS